MPNQNDVKTNFQSYAIPVVLALGSLLAACLITLQPAANGPVAAIFPPWWSARQAIVAAASAGAVIRFGALPCIVILLPDGPPSGLRRAGAWAILNPAALGGCGGQPNKIAP